MKSYSETIYEDVRSRILSGALPQGTRLVEKRLSQDYGSSQGPVREALQRLVQEGLAVRQRNVGTEVVSIGEDDFAAIMELRGHLEEMATRRAASLASDAELAALRDPVDRMMAAAKKNDRPARMQADLEFHSMISSLSKSAVIERAWQSIYAQAMLVMVLAPHTAASEVRTARIHIPILEALLARDADAAVLANLAHLPDPKTLEPVGFADKG